jgi:hypothetical protein
MAIGIFNYFQLITDIINLKNQFRTDTGSAFHKLTSK